MAHAANMDTVHEVRMWWDAAHKGPKMCLGSSDGIIERPKRRAKRAA